jgi:alpha-1,3-rhamnosyl/mannosyltransferase
VSRQQLEELYAQASVFAFPSLDEGFGMPILEAMARGVPVLTANRPALLEVGGKAAYYVNPSDTDALANGLNRMIGDENLRRDLTNKGIERSAEFTWERAVEQTWAVYREVI